MNVVCCLILMRSDDSFIYVNGYVLSLHPLGEYSEADGAYSVERADDYHCATLVGAQCLKRRCQSFTITCRHYEARATDMHSKRDLDIGKKIVIDALYLYPYKAEFTIGCCRLLSVNAQE